MDVKSFFNVAMTIWCAFFFLWGLFGIFGAASLMSALVHLLCMAVQLGFGTMFALSAKKQFCDFYVWVKEILKK